MTKSARSRINDEAARRMSDVLDALRKQQPTNRPEITTAEFLRRHAEQIRALIQKGFSVHEIGDALRKLTPAITDGGIKTNIRPSRLAAANSSVDKPKRKP